MNLETALESYMEYLAGRNLSMLHLNTVRSRLSMFVWPKDEFPTDRRQQEPQSVKPTDLHQHFHRLEAGGRSDGTLAGYASTHRAFWNWCQACGYVTDLPTTNLKRYSFEPHHRRAAPRAHVIAVAAVLSSFAAQRDYHPRDVRDALAVSICLDCGGRIGEIRSLRRRALEIALTTGVVMPNGRVRYSIIGRGKTGAADLCFFDETAVFARMWLQVSPWPKAEHIFINLQNGRLMHIGPMSRCFDRVCKFADVPVFRAHAIRKRNASDLQQLFNDPELTRQYLGHNSIHVTMRHYNDFTHERVNEAASEIVSLRRGDPLDKLFKPKKEGSAPEKSATFLGT